MWVAPVTFLDDMVNVRFSRLSFDPMTERTPDVTVEHGSLNRQLALLLPRECWGSRNVQCLLSGSSDTTEILLPVQAFLFLIASVVVVVEHLLGVQQR